MRLLGAGDNVVDRYLDTGVMYPGGNAVNVAVYARRCGAESSYWGRVGTDRAGDVVLTALRAEQVDVSGVRRVTGANAHADVVVVDGDRIFKDSDDGVSDFELSDADYTRLGDFDVVHTAYSGSLIEAVPRMAGHTRVSFDFSNRYDEPYVARLLPHLYLAAHSGSDLDDEQVGALLADGLRRGARHVLVTRGGAGARLATAAGEFRQPSVATDVVDTMGAGDAFIAGLLTGLLTGDSPTAALTRAARTAAGACAVSGAFGHPAPIPAPLLPHPQGERS
ncbi:Fructosamine kinase FrlD [Micromonospora sp. MH33]|uniref:PfkB family carbohydrate kinase n=1 Tax=Micromonospora sp. MH33 TaxID=1945509 RepID=UPI000D148A69|nr:PfkB family carbohydrate kinase [Micromonospora sp. MH33]PSK67283.1 Fructosamine kinase FrlD [Micromonospora sp. MH33]